MSEIYADKIPEELKTLDHWVCWEYVEREGGKPKKCPLNPHTGRKASTRVPKSWSSFDKALSKHLGGLGDGIGFVVTEGDPYVGIDIDNCRDSKTGELESWAEAIIFEMDSYTEVTPSQTGIRLWIKGTKPEGGSHKGNVEIYAKVWYFTITGDHLEGTPLSVMERQSELEALHASVFAEENPCPASAPSNAPSSTQRSFSIKAIINFAKRAKNGAKFIKLFEGNWEEDYESQSDADLALCAIAGFHAGYDPDAIDSIFRQSALYRDKWDENHFSDGRTYGEATIETALSGVVNTDQSTDIAYASAVRPVAREAKDLVPDNNSILRIPTSAPVSSSTNSLLHPDQWVQDDDSFIYHEQFSSGNSVTSFIADMDVLEGRPEALACEAAFPIVSLFEILTAQLHLLLASYVAETEKQWEESVRVPVVNIIKDLGLDRRTDLTKAEKINKIVAHAGLLNGLCVKVIWRQGKKDLSVRACRMWDIAIDYKTSLISGDGVENARVVSIIVRPGQWAEKFLNREEINQFGYISKHVLQFDSYHHPMVVPLSMYLIFQGRIKIAKKQPMKYRVGHLLGVVLGKDRLEEITSDRKFRNRLADQWDNTLITLHQNNWQITFDPDTYPTGLIPSTLSDDNGIDTGSRRARGYFTNLLNAMVFITPPEYSIKSYPSIKK